MDKLIENLKTYKDTLFFTFLAIIVSFGALLFDVILVTDDWDTIVVPNFLEEYCITIGRWLHTVIGDFFAQKTFAPTFSFLFFVASLLAVLPGLLKRLNLKNNTVGFLFGCIFFTCPLWFEAHLFAVGRIQSGISFMLSFASAFLLYDYFIFNQDKKNKNFVFAISCIMAAFCISIYQTHIFFTVSFLLIIVLENIKNFEFNKILRLFGLIALFCLTTIILYVAFVKFSLWYYDLELKSTGKYAIDKVVHVKDLNFDLIKSVFKFFTQEQLLIPQFFKILISAFILLFGFFKINELRLSNTKNKTLKIVMSIGLIVALLVIPFSLVLVRGNSAIRYNSLVPIVLPLAYFSTKVIGYIKIQKVKNIAILLLISLVLSNLFWNSAGTFAMLMSNKRDLAFTQELLVRIHDFDDYNPDNSYGVYFIGSNQFTTKSRPFDIINQKDIFYNVINCGLWDCQSHRLRSAIKQLGEPAKLSFKSTKSQQSRKIWKSKSLSSLGNDRLKKIKSWPSKDSVVMLNDKKSILVFLDTKSIDIILNRKNN